MDELKLQKCKSCGSILDYSKVVGGVVECIHCGRKHTVAKSDSAAKNYLDMGMHGLDTCDFDDAFIAYQKAAELDKKEPEAYFGMALANAKVQYLKDYVNNRLQPIVHEVTEKSFLQDKYFKKALEFATSEQKKVYSDNGKEIDEIRRQFYELKKSGLRYDCFICVKVTEDNKHTEDSHMANKLYHDLKDAGYNPFYSEEEIKGRTGADYEALILYALHSSSSMLLVCYDESYLQTPWVKNEYTRYLSLLNQEEKHRDSLTIIFSDTVIEKLPGVSGKIQGISARSYDAQSRVIKFVDKFIQKTAPEVTRKEYTNTQYKKKNVIKQSINKRHLTSVGQGIVTVSDKAKLKMASNLLKSRNFEGVINITNVLIEENPSNSEAYWMAFLAQNNCVNDSELINLECEIKDYDFFEKAISSSSDFNRKKGFYNILLEKVKKSYFVADYKEYIELPDSDKNAINDLTLTLFEKAESLRDKTAFDVLIKTVTDAEVYVLMNYSFAKVLEQDEAIEYYKNILKVDEGHYDALWQVFKSEFNFDEDKILQYCCDVQNQAAIENRLFNFGFNRIAEIELFKIVVTNIDEKYDKCLKLFDFILSIIPKEEEILYTSQLKEITVALIEGKQYSLASKYSDLWIEADNHDYNAYFCRCLIDNELNNPIGLVKYIDTLYMDANYINATNLYEEQFPDEENNMFISITQSLTQLKELKNFPRVLEYICENYPIDFNNLESYIKDCKEEIDFLIKRNAEIIYADILNKYKCKDKEAFLELSIDVTKDIDWMICQEFAEAGKVGKISKNVEFIIQNQRMASLKKQADKMFKDALKSYNCDSIKDLNLLRRDVTKDECWNNILEFAKKIKYQKLINDVNEILERQSEFVINNLNDDEKVKQNKKNILFSYRFFASSILFSFVCAFTMVLTLILAMAKVDRAYDFWLMTFQYNEGALYGVGIVLLIIPMTMHTFLLCKSLISTARGSDILGHSSLIIILTVVCLSVGVSKYGPLHVGETAASVVLISIFIVGLSIMCGFVLFREGKGKNPLYIGNGYMLRLRKLKTLKEVEWSIKEYYGNIKKVVLPNTYQNYPIVCIEDGAFGECNTTVESIVIPQTIRLVQFEALLCKKLKEVTIYNESISISKNSFYPNILTSICTKFDNGYYLGNEDNPFMIFMKAKNEPNCIIHKDTKCIASMAFNSYSYFNEDFKLLTIVIPKGVIKICDRAFLYCKSLNRIEIPDTVKFMGKRTFEGCHNMTVYCEAKEKPVEWNEQWNDDCRSKIVWDYTNCTIKK